MSDDGTVIWIESTRGGPGGEPPMCLVHWGSAHWAAPVDDVRKTALDLVTCAAYAEMMITMGARLELAPRIINGFASDVISRANPGAAELGSFGLRSTVLVMPAGSSRRGEPYVLLRAERAEASRRGMVGAGHARRMALHWLEVAEASEQDRLVAQALDACQHAGGEVNEADLFEKLRELRAEEPT